MFNLDFLYSAMFMAEKQYSLSKSTVDWENKDGILDKEIQNGQYKIR